MVYRPPSELVRKSQEYSEWIAITDKELQEYLESLETYYKERYDSLVREFEKGFITKRELTTTLEGERKKFMAYFYRLVLISPPFKNFIRGEIINQVKLIEKRELEPLLLAKKSDLLFATTSISIMILGIVSLFYGMTQNILIYLWGGITLTGLVLLNIFLESSKIIRSLKIAR